MTEYKTHTDILSRTEIINDVICMNMIIRIPKVQYITNLMNVFCCILFLTEDAYGYEVGTSCSQSGMFYPECCLS